MKKIIWTLLLLPLPALALESHSKLYEQVRQNTADIVELQEEQVVQDKRILRLELTDPVPGPQGPPGPPGPPGGAPPGVSAQALQIQSGLNLTSGLRWLVADHYRLNGFYAADNATAGAEPAATWSNQYVERATVMNGLIEILFRADAAPEISGARVVLFPTDPGSSVVWFDCVGDGITDPYLAELQCAFFDPPHEPTASIRRQVETSVDIRDRSGLRELIEAYYLQNGFWPGSNAELGLGAPHEFRNRYVDFMEVSNIGLITAVFGNQAHRNIRFQSLTWIPIDNGSTIEWQCTSEIPLAYLPLECRN